MAVETASWIGARLATRYDVTARLGEGGMGFVYRARDRNLDSDVVIKVPRAAMLEDPDFAGRFTREVRSLVKLSHPAIIKVSDVGDHEGTPFAVLQYLPGGSLRDRQPTDPSGKPRPMRADDLHSWLAAVAGALDFMHRQRFIHRDVKPDNILFDAHGHAFISDFGIAKVLAEETVAKPRTVHTRSGLVLGTPQYMAPEMILGDKYDGRADQYALAVTVYELVSGCYPFDGPNPTAIFLKQTTGEPTALTKIRPDLPPGLCRAVHRALSREPQDRYPDCTSFFQDVLTGLTDIPRREGERGSDGGAAPAVVGAAMPCPGCGKTVKVPPEARGKRARCPACRRTFEVPATAPVAAAAAAGARGDVKARTPVPHGEIRLQRKPATPSPSSRRGRRGLAIVAAFLFGLLAVGGALFLRRDQETPGVEAVAPGSNAALPSATQARSDSPPPARSAAQRPTGAQASEPPEAPPAAPTPVKKTPAKVDRPRPKPAPRQMATTVADKNPPSTADSRANEDSDAKPQPQSAPKEMREPPRPKEDPRALANAEADAKSKLRLAKKFADDATMEFAKFNRARGDQLQKSAGERLKAILKDYPNTEAAKEAKKLLEKMGK